jgi:hypothetical protein
MFLAPRCGLGGLNPRKKIFAFAAFSKAIGKGFEKILKAVLDENKT